MYSIKVSKIAQKYLVVGVTWQDKCLDNDSNESTVTAAGNPPKYNVMGHLLVLTI